MVTVNTAQRTEGASWRDLYPVHPCADVFPMMSDEALDALAADIKQHGLQKPILLVRMRGGASAVIDGRNRLEALARLGVEFSVSTTSVESPSRPGGTPYTFEHVDSGTDVPAFVISANIRRRHLTKEEQAELIVRTVEASAATDPALVARSVSRDRNGRVNGSTKDPVLEKSITAAAKEGISKRVVQKVRAKIRGKVPASRKKVGLSKTPPASAARSLTARQPQKRNARRAVDQAMRTVEASLREALSPLSADERAWFFDGVRTLIAVLEREAWRS